jgi:rod shape determining protein RodA
MNSSLRILVVAVLIAIVGISAIYSSTYQAENRLWQSQIIWVFIGICLYFFFLNFNHRRLWDATYALYISALVLLILVYFLGKVSLGAQRWLRFAWFNVQPSELAKLAVIIFLARYYSNKSFDDVLLSSPRYGIFRALVIPFVFTLIPVGMIMDQPDLGSALMVLAIFFGMLYAAHVRMKYILIVFAFGLVILPFFWAFLRDYQKDRLMVFLNPNIDPLGAGYTLIQSKIAIGSGGLLGKGWLAGTQSQLHFLPESHTDFIFATFAEQWGMLGSAGLLCAYIILINETFSIAQRTSDHFGKLIAFGIGLMFSMQIFVNLSMTMGLAPVVGLPLPLMSYGGSSIVVTFVSLGILANINKTRTIF